MIHKESKATPNAQWYTSGDVPDPKPLPVVLGYMLLIRPLAPPEKTSKGGIIIPDGTKEVLGFMRAVGKVLALGKTAYMDGKFQGDPWCKVGDYVLYGRNTGAKFIWGGVNLLILNDDEILATTTEPSMLFD